MDTPQLTPRQLSRFWANIDRTSDCWIWSGCKDKDGYGVFSANGTQYRAHRIAWAITNGEIPDGLILRHSCDNPSCCNPVHLSTGTHADNVTDKLIRNRGAKGESINTAKLTEADVLRIREVFAAGVSGFVLADMYGVLPCNIYRIASGKYWRHVGGPRTSRPYDKKSLRQGVDHA